MEELSITRALAELKLLDSRIMKKITSTTYVTVKSNKHNKNFNYDQYEQNTKSDYQSLMDLINRRHKIKSAIILSNATTEVKLGNETFTIAEIIERKQMIVAYKALFDKMKNDRELTRTQIETNNQRIETDLQRILEVSFGKSSNNKTNAQDIETISVTYRKENNYEIFDPLNIDNKLKDIEALIDNYDREANFVLSESNALTKVKI